MNSVLWKQGTFSHETSNFNNSVWLGGEFNNGNFNNSYFNPYVDISLSGLDEDAFRFTRYYVDFLNRFELLFDLTKKISDETYLSGKLVTFTGYPNTLVSQLVDLISSYELLYLEIEWDQFNSYNLDYTGQSLSKSSFSELKHLAATCDVCNPGVGTIIKVYNKSLTDLREDDFVIIIVEPKISYSSIDPNVPITHQNKIKYYYKYKDQEDKFDFNRSETCVWTGGNFNSGEFNFSKWLAGNFNGGLMFGGIWKDGIFNYGTMSNSYWENGTWRNGTWNGSPFDYESLIIEDDYFTVVNNKNKFIIQNISSYADNNFVHINNILIKDPNTTERFVHNFQSGGVEGLKSWTYSTTD